MEGFATMVRTVAVLLLICSVACASPTDPRTFDSEEIFVSVRVVPDVIRTDGSAEAVAVFHNKTDESQSILFPDYCVFTTSFFDRESSQPAEFDRSKIGCALALFNLELPPMDSVIIRHPPLQARIEGESAPRGEYVARFEFHTDVVPDLKAFFTIE